MSIDSKPTLKDRIIAILKGSGKPIDFEKIYIALTKDGHPMPAAKPKLVVRKVLYNAELFTNNKGSFEVKAGVTGESVPSAPAAPVPAAAPAPAIAVPVSKPAVPAPTPTPAVPPAPAAPATPAVPAGPTVKMKDRIIALLKKAGNPMTMDKVYEELTKDGHPMPAAKPKLVVRKVLYNAELFTNNKGAFEVKEGVTGDALPAGSAGSAAPDPAGEKPAEEPKPIVPSIDYSVATKEAAADVAKAAADEARKAARAAAKEAAELVAEETAKRSIERKAAGEAARKAAVAAAADAARQAAADAARQAAIEAAREVALEAAQEAAAEATRQAAQEAAEDEMIRKATEEAAREAAREAAKEGREAAIDEAREAARAAAREAAIIATREALATVREQASKPAPEQPALAEPPAPEPPASAIAPEPPPKTKTITPAQPSGKSGQGSIRERAKASIISARRPLSLDEILDALKTDGYPLPTERPREVLKRVLDNKRLFGESSPGLYLPVKEI